MEEGVGGTQIMHDIIPIYTGCYFRQKFRGAVGNAFLATCNSPDSHLTSSRYFGLPVGKPNAPSVQSFDSRELRSDNAACRVYPSHRFPTISQLFDSRHLNRIFRLFYQRTRQIFYGHHLWTLYSSFLVFRLWLILSTRIVGLSAASIQRVHSFSWIVEFRELLLADGCFDELRYREQIFSNVTPQLLFISSVNRADFERSRTVRMFVTTCHPYIILMLNYCIFCYLNQRSTL